MLIAEKAGRVRLFQNDYLLPDLWLDISGEVTSFGDRGLASIAIGAFQIKFWREHRAFL